MALRSIPLYGGCVRDSLRLLFVLSEMTLPVMFYSGGQFFTGAWAALKRHSADMNTLIALGTSAAWIFSTVALLFPESSLRAPPNRSTT